METMILMMEETSICWEIRTNNKKSSDRNNKKKKNMMMNEELVKQFDLDQ